METDRFGRAGRNGEIIGRSRRRRMVLPDGDRNSACVSVAAFVAHCYYYVNLPFQIGVHAYGLTLDGRIFGKNRIGKNVVFGILGRDIKTERTGVAGEELLRTGTCKNRGPIEDHGNIGGILTALRTLLLKTQEAGIKCAEHEHVRCRIDIGRSETSFAGGVRQLGKRTKTFELENLHLVTVGVGGLYIKTDLFRSAKVHRGIRTEDLRWCVELKCVDDQGSVRTALIGHRDFECEDTRSVGRIGQQSGFRIDTSRTFKKRKGQRVVFRIGGGQLNLSGSTEIAQLVGQIQIADARWEVHRNDELIVVVKRVPLLVHDQEGRRISPGSVRHELIDAERGVGPGRFVCKRTGSFDYRETG